MSGKKTGSLWKRILWIGAILVFLFISAGGWWFYRVYYVPNVHTPDHNPEYLYIHTGTTMSQLMIQLKEEKIVDDTASFATIARLKKFSEPKPGRYKITDDMNNRELVDRKSTRLN